MAWIYLAESAESDRLWLHGFEQKRIVKKTDLLSPCFFQEWNEEKSTEPQSGMTSQPSKDQCSPELTSSSEDSPAKTSALLAAVSAWQESEAAYFSRSCGYPKKSSPRSYSLKMSQQLELEDLNTLPKPLPVPGMIVGGTLYPLKKLEPATKEKDGSFLPTPTAQSYGTSQNGQRSNGTTFKQKGKASLNTMAIRGLIPTPLARDAKGMMGREALIRRNSPNLPDSMNGPLNPQFVEEIMGYNIDATALSASGIQWFHFKRKKHL